MKTTIRLAQVQDAADLGSIHVRAWQKAYRGLLPQKYLDGLSISERQAMWAEEIRFYESQGWNNNGDVRSRELFGINVEEVCYRCSFH